jgi:hypothetical protein
VGNLEAGLVGELAMRFKMGIGENLGFGLIKKRILGVFLLV